MERPFVDWVRVENFRCVKRADLHLTRLHALIGPNDSGKSSLLTAIAHHPRHTRYWNSGARFTYSAKVASVAMYPDSGEPIQGPRGEEIVQSFRPRRLLRFDPDELRLAGNLIPKSEELWFQSEKGRALASLYDALLNRDRDSFTAIDKRFRELFPTCRSLRLENADAATKTMGLTLFDGSDVGPNEMSEGMLYWLAFAIIEKLQAPAMLLIEEPENGLHPARIAEVMKVLREISKRTQIILATHSPLVINELAPNEVTVVTRTNERGTICTPMTETKNFVERSKIYALGE